MQRGQTHVSGVEHGTAMYTAPEVLASGKASKAADVYAFGVLAWELLHQRSALQYLLSSLVALGSRPGTLSHQPGALTFTVPFDAAWQQANQEQGGPHAAPSGPPEYENIQQQLADLVMKCMAEDASMRPSFDDLEQQLDKLCKQVRVGQ